MEKDYFFKTLTNYLLPIAYLLLTALSSDFGHTRHNQQIKDESLALSGITVKFEQMYLSQMVCNNA